MTRQIGRHHHQVVVAVLLERGGTFKKRRFLAAFEELSVESALLHGGEVRLEFRHAAGPVEAVHPSVVVEQDGAVVEMRRARQELPRALGTVRGVDKSARAVGDEPGVELSSVMHERGRPLASAVRGLSILQRILRTEVEPVEDVRHRLPVNHVLRAHHGRAGDEVHRRRHQIDIVARPAHRRVGTVGVDDRIAVRGPFARTRGKRRHRRRKNRRERK